MNLIIFRIYLAGEFDKQTHINKTQAMAEIVASAVVGETLSRISSFLIDNPGQQKPSDVKKKKHHSKFRIGSSEAGISFCPP